MLLNSIDIYFDERQYRSAWKFELERLNGSQVFCPMCEDTHENNTNCQRSD